MWTGVRPNWPENTSPTKSALACRCSILRACSHPYPPCNSIHPMVTTPHRRAAPPAKAHRKKLGPQLCQGIFPQARLKAGAEPGTGPDPVRVPARRDDPASETPPAAAADTIITIYPFKDGDQRITLSARWKPSSLAWE